MSDQRTFTPQEFADKAKEAVENWDWDAEIVTERTQRELDIMKESLTFDAEYAERVFADEDGAIRLSRGFSIWDQLHEFAVATAANENIARPGI